MGMQPHAGSQARGDPSLAQPFGPIATLSQLLDDELQKNMTGRIDQPFALRQHPVVDSHRSLAMRFPIKPTHGLFDYCTQYLQGGLGT